MPREFYANHYRSGERIRRGDEISWAGRPGRVIYVLGDPDCPAEFIIGRDFHMQEEGQGFLLEVSGPGFVFESESNEDLELVRRHRGDEKS